MSKRSVKDYPVEYFDIWRLASKGTLSLDFPSKGYATNKKVDLQRFRKRLAEESPELAEEFFQVDLMVEGDHKWGKLKGYVPLWKQQVRKQIADSDLSSAAITEIASEVLEQKEQAATDEMGAMLDTLGYKAPE